MRSLAFATGGSADNVADTTAKAGIVPDGFLSRDAFSIATEAGSPEITDGNEAAAASDAYPPNGMVEDTFTGTFAGGDGVFTVISWVDDTAGPAQDVI